MKQKNTSYLCNKCGHTETKWMGQCPSCKGWNTFTEFSESQVSSKSNAPKKDTINIVPLDEIEIVDGKNRFDSGIGELDRVLGGGIVNQSIILLGGAPGIGKSTLLLQLSSSLEKSVLYVSGEESASQIKMRADRLNLKNMSNVDLLCSTNLDDIMKSLSKKPYSLIVIDSIQTMFSYDIDSASGSVTQIKYTSSELASFTKQHQTVLLLIAHITKEGFIAGPKILEHMVDTVIYFEEGKDDLRYIVTNKNRFGQSGEIGFFSMGATGLTEIKDPQTYFFNHDKNISSIGVLSVLSYEGSRVIPVEIQSLVTQGYSGLKTYADKIDGRRIIRLCAIISNQIGLAFADNDVFVNTAGGIRIDDTGADLSIALAVYSSKIQKPIPQSYACVGELTLSGDVRSVKQLKKRIMAGFELGYTNIIGPMLSKSDKKEDKLSLENENYKYHSVKTLKDAINIINKLP